MVEYLNGGGDATTVRGRLKIADEKTGISWAIKDELVLMARMISEGKTEFGEENKKRFRRAVVLYSLLLPEAFGWILERVKRKYEGNPGFEGNFRQAITDVLR